MLRDVVIHIANEQPVMADLINEPAPSDVALICTNMRTMNGKKPVFIDASDSLFVIPLVHVRFVEVHRSAMDALDAEGEKGLMVSGGDTDRPSGDPRAGAVQTAEPPEPPEPPEPLSDELDPELLRRIREA
jgi:hypothetical protein